MKHAHHIYGLMFCILFVVGFSRASTSTPLAQSGNANDGASAQAIEQRYKQETDAFEKAFDEFEKSAPLGQEFHYDLSPLAASLQSAMHSSDNPATRQTAALYLLMMRDYLVNLPSSTYFEAVRLIPADSDVWKKSPRSLGYASEELSAPEARHLLKEVVAQNPDHSIQGQALIAQAKLARRQHDMPLYNATYHRLQAYKSIEGLDFEISLLNPDNKIAIGKKAPFFVLPEIGGAAGATFSTKSLTGKYYLLDFWATWCGPCVAERAALLRAHERYKTKGFAIVSISLDKTPDAVVQYRHARWSMPWENLFLPDGQKSQTAKDFDVDWIGLPRLILVDPKGSVVALQDDLGRDTLERTLARYLKS